MYQPFFVNQVELRASASKQRVEKYIKTRLHICGLYDFEIVDKPWGVEINIGMSQLDQFLENFFFDLTRLPAAIRLNPAGPKVLVIEQGKRLSWHVHEYKDAFLKVKSGRVEVTLSATDEEPRPRVVFAGAEISVPPLMRHRLGSVDGWSVILELSRDGNQSDLVGEDTRRIKDDFGRIE